jgi:hypothetical protein
MIKCIICCNEYKSFFDDEKKKEINAAMGLLRT